MATGGLRAAQYEIAAKLSQRGQFVILGLI
jgi:hypothetical protein